MKNSTPNTLLQPDIADKPHMQVKTMLCSRITGVVVLGVQIMENKKLLLDNIEKLHTTEMGMNRIRRNLKLEHADVIVFCKEKILDINCNIYKQGKNWYCEIDGVKITVNSYSYTIITAHRL